MKGTICHQGNADQSHSEMSPISTRIVIIRNEAKQEASCVGKGVGKLPGACAVLTRRKLAQPLQEATGSVSKFGTGATTWLTNPVSGYPSRRTEIKILKRHLFSYLLCNTAYEELEENKPLTDGWTKKTQSL